MSFREGDSLLRVVFRGVYGRIAARGLGMVKHEPAEVGEACAVPKVGMTMNE